MRFEIYSDASQLSCKDVIDGTYYSKENGWEKMEDEEARQELFELFKEYVAKTAKGNRRRRIMQAELSQMETCGILARLYYNFKREEVEYICGQERYSEMAILRNLFDY